MNTALVAEEIPAKNSGPDQDWLTRGRELASEDAKFQREIKARQFAIGDWLAEGVEKWERKAYKEAAAIFPNYTLETLRNFASVARAVESSLRNDVLSFSHHAAVMRFEGEPEIQTELLAEAAEMELPLRTFRSRIARKYPPDKPEKPPKLTLTPNSKDMEALAQLALKLGNEQEAVALRLLRWALLLPDIARKLGEMP